MFSGFDGFFFYFRVHPSYKHFLLNDLGLGVVTRLKNFVVA